MLDQKIIVGSLNQLSSIASVTVAFYNQDNTIVQDDGGRLLQFTSSPVDLGHELELFFHQSAYSHVKFILTILSDTGFDPEKIFFHFSQRSTSPAVSTTTETSTAKVNNTSGKYEGTPSHSRSTENHSVSNSS